MLGLSKRRFACWVSVILLLIGTMNAHSKNPTPTLADSDQKPKPNATQEIKQVQEDKRGTENAPVVIKVLPPPELQVTTKKSADEHRDYSSAEWWLVYGTLALFTATIGLMVFTLKLWGATKMLVEGANNAEAAYILPHVIRPEGFYSDALTLPGGRPQIRYGFKNHGKTLAVIRRWRDFTSSTLPTRPRFEESWDAREHQYIPVVGDELGGELWTQIPEGMTATSALAHLNDGYGLYIIGEVEYEDIFGVVRVQGYCLRIVLIQPDSWRYWREGGRAYNQRRQIH